jgi:hypothetical protein
LGYTAVFELVVLGLPPRCAMEEEVAYKVFPICLIC